MDNLFIATTTTSPGIDCRFDRHRLSNHAAQSGSRVSVNWHRDEEDETIAEFEEELKASFDAIAFNGRLVAHREAPMTSASFPSGYPAPRRIASGAIR